MKFGLVFFSNSDCGGREMILLWVFFLYFLILFRFFRVERLKVARFIGLRG